MATTRQTRQTMRSHDRAVASDSHWPQRPRKAPFRESLSQILYILLVHVDTIVLA